VCRYGPKLYGMVVTSLFLVQISYIFRIVIDLSMTFICFSPENFVNGLTWRSPYCDRRKYPQQKEKDGAWSVQ
jgi:hypothetical protein